MNSMKLLLLFGFVILTSCEEDGYRRRQLFEASLYEHFIGMGIDDSIPVEKGDSDVMDRSHCMYYNPGENNEDGEWVLSYWSYEVCLNQNITQFHLQLRSTQDHQLGLEYEIIENNHIGSFINPSAMPRLHYLSAVNNDWGKEEALNLAMDKEIPNGYYTGGSSCGAMKRGAKIVIANDCCGGIEKNSRIKDQHPNQFDSVTSKTSMLSIFPQQSDTFKILDVQEEAICKYSIQVCRKCSNPWIGTTENEQQLMKTFMHRTLGSNYFDGDRKAFPPIPQSKVESDLKKISSMFEHAFDSYLEKAYPESELRPLSCRGGTFDLVRIPALTLIDSLSTFILMGNYTMFAQSIERLRCLDASMKRSQLWGNDDEKGGIFAIDQNVSVFETNIRVLGGLLSSHQMAEAWMGRKVTIDQVNKRNDKDCRRNETTNHHQYWEYDGFLLSLAEDIGKRLLRAFGTNTGIPYGTVNLLYGVPAGETTVASLAGGGTLTIEMELLSRLTGDESFGKAAKLATRAYWIRRSKLGLLGKHIDVQSGIWKETLSGVGSNSDSFYEYLLKHYLIFPEDDDFWFMFQNAYSAIYRHSRFGDWYVDVDMNNGLKSARPNFESLMAFYPGIQVLLGENTFGSRTTNSICNIREDLGFLPERFDFAKMETKDSHYPLRPELYESIFFLHRATKDISVQLMKDIWNVTTSISSAWQWSTDFAIRAIEQMAKTDCGFAGIKNVSPETTGQVRGGKAILYDEMPSFFISETLKYFYLTMDSANILNTDQSREWVFTTEAQAVHHNGNDDSSFKILKHRMLRSLKGQMNRATDQTYPVPTIDRTAVDESKLREEKWTSDTSLDTYMNQIKNEIGRKKDINETVPHLVNIFGKIIEVSNTTFILRRSNIALMNSYERSKGDGHRLTKSCPNDYHPSSLWLHAMDNTQVDYDEFFATKFFDTSEASQNDNDSDTRTALSTSALYGTRLFHNWRRQEGCPTIRKNVEEESSVGEKIAQSERRFHFDGLGNFDIVSLHDGSGFHIRHVDSGESLRATIFDLTDEQSSFITVELSKPMQEASTIGSATNVALADLQGNSFMCSVEVRRIVQAEHDSHQQYSPLQRFPCLPAQYGPSHITNLVKSSGVSLQASLVAVNEDGHDVFGCGSEDEVHHAGTDEEEMAFPRIRLVRRGVCPFRQKSKTYCDDFTTDAIIVLNNEENQLFVMTDSVTEPRDLSCQGKEPVSVLISKSDGDDVISLGKQYPNQLEARVRIVPQEYDIEDTSNEKVNHDWPIVITSSTQVQIFASQGWGVMVERNVANTVGEKWKVMLLQHEIKI